MKNQQDSLGNFGFTNLSGLTVVSSEVQALFILMSFPVLGWTLSKKLDSSQPVLSLLQNQALGPGGGDKGLSGTPGGQVASRNTGRPCVLD